MDENSNENYNKYLKYKSKYLQLKQQQGGDDWNWRKSINDKVTSVSNFSKKSYNNIIGNNIGASYSVYFYSSKDTIEGQDGRDGNIDKNEKIGNNKSYIQFLNNTSIYPIITLEPATPTSLTSSIPSKIDDIYFVKNFNLPTFIKQIKLGLWVFNFSNIKADATATNQITRSDTQNISDAIKIYNNNNCNNKIINYEPHIDITTVGSELKEAFLTINYDEKTKKKQITLNQYTPNTAANTYREIHASLNKLLNQIKLKGHDSIDRAIIVEIPVGGTILRASEIHGIYEFGEGVCIPDKEITIVTSPVSDNVL